MFENLCIQVIMLDLKISITITNNATKFLKIQSTKLKFCLKKLLFSTEYKQEVSEFLLHYDGSTLKNCARFTESVTKIIQPSKYKITMFENLCNQVIMLDLKISITITNNAIKFLKIQSAKFKFCMKKYYLVLSPTKKFKNFCFPTMEVRSKSVRDLQKA